MSFDIHQLDYSEGYDEEAFESYQNDLLEQFIESPEGQAHRMTYPEMGFWAEQLMNYGFGYIGVAVPRMATGDVIEIVTEIFPRKISLSSPEEADGALPEIIAFWEFLKREYKLSNANRILEFLRTIKTAEFKNMMFDSTKFGMAKSLVMAGCQAGFDMTDIDQMNAFMHLYNAQQLAASNTLPDRLPPKRSKSRQDKAREKKKRKAAKAARKRNRKR